MNINLKNKVILITGASKGIGAEVARRCAIEGAKVVINYCSDIESAEDVEKTITNHGGNCIVVRADITRKEEVTRLKKIVMEAYGRVDVLINNAGSCNDNLCPMMSYEQWKSILSVNLDGVFLMTRAFTKIMIRQGEGKVINIASLKGVTGSRGQVNYSASKAGVIGFTKALARDLADFNISVNAVCPGFIQTNMNKENITKKVNAQKQSLLGIEENMNDLVDFIVYACSDYFRRISGQVFFIDSRI